MSTKTAADGYNGPNRDKTLETAGDYEEQRAIIMRATSRCGAILRAHEAAGGHKADIQDIYVLRKMTPEEQRAELRRQIRVGSWLNIVDENAVGQRSFLKAFEEPAGPIAVGIGQAPLGSKLSLVRANTAGFNDGKARKGPGLQDGLAVYAESLGWEPDSLEALEYTSGWGEGNLLRPAPKERSGDDANAEEGAAEDEPGTDSPEYLAYEAGHAAGKAGTKPDRKTYKGIEKEAYMRGWNAGQAELGREMAAPADEKPGWDGSRDFTDEVTGPIH